MTECLGTIVFSPLPLPADSLNTQLITLICATCRALMAALLHHISVHPHAVVIESLGLISSNILQPAQGLPPTVQAEAFSDAALLQASLSSSAASDCSVTVYAYTLSPTPMLHCFHSPLPLLGTELN